MKLAYLDPNPLPEQQTVPLQILQNVNAFAQNGAQVFLFNPEGSLPADEVLGHPLHSEVQHHTTKNLKKSWWYWSGSNRYFYQAARRWLESINPQAIYVRNLKLAYYLLHHTSIPIFFEAHEVFCQSFAESHPMTWRNRRKLTRLDQIERAVYHQCHGIIAITKTLSEDLRQRYRFSTPILISPSGYDDQLIPSKISPLSHHEKVIILYLGSLHPWKGMEILLDAAPYIHHQGEIWIAGGSPQDRA
ncbi:MAG TPA: glycosyltransferase, partial [Candidatus Nitrosotenuis sp.]|nr:glycosyltransferase [Candidatus Nitrosotenuis sp.]